MTFRAYVLLITSLLVFLAVSCGGNPDASNPVLPSKETPSAPFTASSTLQEGHNLLGYFLMAVDSDAGTVDVIPVRITDMHLNVLQFLEFGPCFDCLSIANFEKLPNKDLTFDVVLNHPFPSPNLTGFDVRGIAMFGGGFNFPNLGVTASSILEDNPELVNPDGHTRLYNPSTEGNGLQGYLKGKIAPGFAAPNAILNGYMAYWSNENRRYFSAGTELSANFHITSPIPVFTFGYAIDASWAKPTEPVTVPDSFPMTANSLEAYKIETDLSGPLALTSGSSTTLTIDVYDWQGASTIQGVNVEAPLFFDGILACTEEAGGPGDKRFTCELTNDFGFVSQGEYPVCIQVLDTASQPTAIVDYVGWKVIHVPVSLNHVPVCSADVSDLEPDVDEVVTFTDTSTDLEGPGDILESWWDWDNNGVWDEEGSVVTHSWSAAGVYEINHKVVDAASAEDDLDDPLTIDVGLFITLQEDYDNKPSGRVYNYNSLDTNYSSGGVINVGDFDGPWDFTTIGLVAGGNRLSVISDDDTEAAGFVGDFNAATTHFMKYENMFDIFFPVLYQAEYHHFISNKLFIYGFHDPYIIGSSPFGPPDTDDSLAIPYPLTTATNYSFDINKPGFVLNYAVKALGEGDVTVPYGGGTTYHCLLLRYRFNISSADPLNGGTLNFAFVSDSGMVVANVVAVNHNPTFNWNPSSNTINSNGDALFQALNTITN